MAVFDLVFDHEDFILVNKSPGVSVHKDEEKESFIDKVKIATAFSNLYLVHRLDKVTSGLLLLAKNSDAASSLSQLFQKREVEKYYLAISRCKPKKKQGLIVGDMSRSRRGSWKLERTKANPASTRFLSFSMAENQRLFVIKPLTGKTHQIRVALKSIGAPILGDTRYGGEAADRCYLHAFGLRFDFKGQHYSFCIPPVIGESFISREFTGSLDKVGEPWNLNWPK